MRKGTRGRAAFFRTCRLERTLLTAESACAYNCPHWVMQMISVTEAKILSLMTRRPTGVYGSELIHMSDGALKRGSVYSLLGRLEKSGFVTATEDPATEKYAVPRTCYRITAQGQRGLREFAEFVALPTQLMGTLA